MGSQMRVVDIAANASVSIPYSFPSDVIVEVSVVADRIIDVMMEMGFLPFKKPKSSLLVGVDRLGDWNIT